MPPICTEPVFFGCNGSETSYWRNSPVPKQETYKKRSSSDRLISVISGGTALNPCKSGGNVAGSAGLAGNSDFFCGAPGPFVGVPQTQERVRGLVGHHRNTETKTRRG